MPCEERTSGNMANNKEGITAYRHRENWQIKLQFWKLYEIYKDVHICRKKAKIRFNGTVWPSILKELEEKGIMVSSLD